MTYLTRVQYDKPSTWTREMRVHERRFALKLSVGFLAVAGVFALIGAPHVTIPAIFCSFLCLHAVLLDPMGRQKNDT